MPVLPGMRSMLGVPIKLRGAFVHKPTPKKLHALKKSPIPMRGYVSSKAAKKPRKKIAKKEKAKR
jgi:hypothetical protein